jgi:hypothetical protein
MKFVFQGLAQVLKALARIAKAGARIGVKHQLPVGLVAPVLKAGLVAEHQAGGQFLMPGIAGYIRVYPVAG